MFTIGGPTERVRTLTLNVRSLRKHLAGVSLAINFPKELNISQGYKYFAEKRKQGLDGFHQREEGERPA